MVMFTTPDGAIDSVTLPIYDTAIDNVRFPARDGAR